MKLRASSRYLNGTSRRLTSRLVSQDPGNYADAPTEGIRRVLETVTGETIPRGQVLDTQKIGTPPSRRTIVKAP